MTSSRDRASAAAVRSPSWAELAVDAPDGLAAVDADGRFVRVNRAGARLLSAAEPELVGTATPFRLAQDVAAEPAGLFDDPDEQVTTWTAAAGVRHELAYRVHRASEEAGVSLVAFRDVTDERHRLRRVAAVARSAAKLASQGSLPATLDALAHEVLQTDALAGVQILSLDDDNQGLRIMGSAGFRHLPDFFDRLLECRARGAPLRMLDALQEGEPIVVPHRWDAIRDDPHWEPLIDYHRELRWDSFVSVPLIIRGRAAGVLNAFLAPGQVAGARAVEFLVAMAEQAAIAVDYATLMERERDVVRRQERQRLARDLHDSIVQQVFSISMQAKSLEVLTRRAEGPPTATVERIADEVGQLAQTVLTDLRAMVHELRPTTSTELGGLQESLRALAESTTNRTGLRFNLTLGRNLDQVCGELADDVYRILAEAIHNVVKHAEAGRVTIRLAVRDGRLTGSVSDDGRGLAEASEDSPARSSGYGLSTMRERAHRWGGTVNIEPRRQSGTVVRLGVPLTTGIPVARPDTASLIPFAPDHRGPAS